MKLGGTAVPAPKVLWYGGEGNEVLITEALPGKMIWDYIDPRRGPYDRDRALRCLHTYGKLLAEIHSLDMTWPPQKRSRLCDLIGEEKVEDRRLRGLSDGFAVTIRLPGTMSSSMAI